MFFFLFFPPPSLDGNIDFTNIIGTQIFWAFSHSSLAPTINIEVIWPFKGIDVINPWGILFLNTIILFSSRVTITWNRHVILARSKKQVVYTSITTRQLSNYQRNFFITSCNHTIIDARNEMDTTYHLNDLEQ